MSVTKIRTGQFNYDADLDANSHKLTNVQDPSSAQDAATKAYVDGLVNGLDWKNSVRVATAVAGTLATSFENGDTIDGVVLATGDRILIKDQASGAENGIYTVNVSGAPTRATDADASAEVSPNLAVFIEEGTANADTCWKLTTNGPITLGSTALVFVQFGAGTSYTAGDASITVSGTTIKQTPGTNGQIDQTVAGVVTPVTVSGDATIASGGAVTLAANILREADIVTRETPSGTVNGSNTNFTLANTPVVGTEHVYLNGILQDAGGGNDYTISDVTITFNTAPLTGDKIRVSYWK